MRKSTLIVSVALAGVIGLPGATSWAHHGVQNQFDVSYQLEKQGELVRIDWINPHAWFHFAEVDENGDPVLGPDGRQVLWSIETTGPSGLRRNGIADRRLFTEGDIYTFTGNPSRTYDPETGEGETTMFTSSITFPDGRTLGITTFQASEDLQSIAPQD